MKATDTFESNLTGENAQLFTFEDLATIYSELRVMASKLMRGERKGHSLHTSALMHAALERLMGADWEEKAWKNPGHFVEAFCRNMQYVLIDHARRRATKKRGANTQRVPFNDALSMCSECPTQLIEINDLLEKLSSCDTLVDPDRKVQVIRLRVFGNLTELEIASVLEVSPATVRRDWRQAKAWLATELDGESESK